VLVNASDPHRYMRIGIDLGGTKIEGIALADNGRIIDRIRVHTPGTYEAGVAAIAELVAKLESKRVPRAQLALAFPARLFRAPGW